MYQALNSELQVLNALATGNREATEQIYKQHNKVVTGWIVQNGGDAIDADDIFQEAIIDVYKLAQNKAFILT